MTSEPGIQIIPLESANSGDVTPITDLINQQSGGSLCIGGTAADLIRDAYDEPHRWVHNGYAQPDDRRKAFLVGRGWTATVDRLKAIVDAGIPWMAINDYPEDGPAPNYWCSGDPPGYFGERIWTNPNVIKFCAMVTKNLLRPRVDGYHPALKTMDAPNVHYFHSVQNCTDVESWLHTPWLNWGTSICTEDVPQLYKASARSSMLIGLRLLWHLGYREVALVGCDCTPHQHHLPKYYETIFHHLKQIKPAFDRFCYDVRQTNRDSHLRVFDFVDFDDFLKAE